MLYIQSIVKEYPLNEHVPENNKNNVLKVMQLIDKEQAYSVSET